MAQQLAALAARPIAAAGRSTRPAAINGVPVTAVAPEAMEGVVATAPVQEAEDPVEEWSNMEGVERDGLFASRHAPDAGEPAPAPAWVSEKPKKRKGNGKEVRPALPVQVAGAEKQKEDK